MYIFADWTANAGNAKGRLVLAAFRLAHLGSKVAPPWRYLLYPYVALYRVLVEWLLCIELPWKLRIGPNLRLHHGQALVINDRVVIGANCVLRNSTTIGVAKTREDYAGVAPIIGDDVDIGANCVIIGAIKIGNGAVIGAGSVVISDIPNFAVAVGNPARVVKLLTPNMEKEGVNAGK